MTVTRTVANKNCSNNNNNNNNNCIAHFPTSPQFLIRSTAIYEVLRILLHSYSHTVVVDQQQWGEDQGIDLKQTGFFGDNILSDEHIREKHIKPTNIFLFNTKQQKIFLKHSKISIPQCQYCQRYLRRVACFVSIFKKLFFHFAHVKAYRFKPTPKTSN